MPNTFVLEVQGHFTFLFCSPSLTPGVSWKLIPCCSLEPGLSSQAEVTVTDPQAVSSVLGCKLQSPGSLKQYLPLPVSLRFLFNGPSYYSRGLLAQLPHTAL